MEAGYIAAMLLIPMFTFFVGVVYGDFKAEEKKKQ